MNVPNDIVELRNGLQRHGGDLGKWPLPARESALRVLAQSASARAELSAAQRLDALLMLGPVPPPAAALRAAILAHAPSARGGMLQTLREFWFELGGLRIAGPALAAAMVIGISLGSALLDARSAEDDGQDLVDLTQLDVDYTDLLQ